MPQATNQPTSMRCIRTHTSIQPRRIPTHTITTNTIITSIDSKLLTEFPCLTCEPVAVLPLGKDIFSLSLFKLHSLASHGADAEVPLFRALKNLGG